MRAPINQQPRRPIVVSGTASATQEHSPQQVVGGSAAVRPAGPGMAQNSPRLPPPLAGGNSELLGRPVVSNLVPQGRPSPLPTTSAAASLLRPTAALTPVRPAISAPVSAPARKRLYSGSGENEEPPSKKKRIFSHKTTAIQSAKDSYSDLVTEYFFLSTGGNIMDYQLFCKRPSQQFYDYCKAHKLDETDSVVKTVADNKPSTPSTTLIESKAALTTVRMPPAKVQVLASKQMQGGTTPTLSDASSSQQNKLVEKAKQEAYIVQRISTLQKEGLWSERRLPKQQEPPRAKAHWDYLLEEMVWLAADFAQERKWKKNAAKKCSKMVQKYFQDKQIQAQRAEKNEEQRMRKIAGFIAKEVRNFWGDVHKLVEFKNKTLLEEKKRKALDQHLSFIVDQTEKYSSQLAKEMGRATEGNSATSVASDELLNSELNSDIEFEPNASSDDDEETIARAEGQVEEREQTEEVKLLEQEANLPLDDVINSLPPQVREAIMQGKMATLDSDKEDHAEEGQRDDDDDFESAQEDSSDDEETIQQQEKDEGAVDYKQELQELEDDNNLSVEQLRAKYDATGDGAEPTEEMDVERDSDDESEAEEDEAEEKNGDEEQSDAEESAKSEDEESDEDDQNEEEEKGTELSMLLENSEEMTDVDKLAHSAEEYQPKGYTLSSTKVETKVPFLLKHGLREYQHVGLEWLATMFNKNLNGILADEMGLGKTIQTIALLAHLACEKGLWGPHLIVVPTSVMLNWEMEFKKWCPAFKILTYYGSQKERRLKRIGWTRENAFHVCITSYKLVIQDHQSFRRKKWVYFILDEAQNIKNFKSQRWQLLLNFQSQRRLLLTGTPLQNNLMELWSLMHFLMPHVFESHKDFREWFSNPLTGMIEGQNEFNESVLKRLHKVLRPFLLRRLKSEVERQLPKKYEHITMCRLSKRQRYLYDDFMSRAKTKETLESGNLLSVINVLMQLRKVCNHPNLFEVRPIISPFQMDGISMHIPSIVYHALDYDHLKDINLSAVNLLRINFEYTTTAYVAHRVKRYVTPKKLIEDIDLQPEPPPRTPQGKIKLNVKANPSSQARPVAAVAAPQVLPGTSPIVKHLALKTGSQVVLKLKGNGTSPSFPVQFIHNADGGPKAVSVAPMNVVSSSGTIGSNPILKTIQRSTTTFPQLVTTAEGKHILVPASQSISSIAGGSTPLGTLTTSAGRPVLRVPPMPAKPALATTPLVVKPNAAASTSAVPGGPLIRTTMSSITLQPSKSLITTMAESVRLGLEVQKQKSPFHLADVEEAKKQARKDKLSSLHRINVQHCESCPLFGADLREACNMMHSFAAPGSAFNPFRWNESSGMISCLKAQDETLQDELWVVTNALRDAILSRTVRLDQLSETVSRFMLYVPAVNAPVARLHASHGHPSKLRLEALREEALCRELAPRANFLHPIVNSMSTQFPDPRLIQYDCGKLQVMDKLLRELKSGGHRALIFTQMTRMLDVLESFLNYHGYIYLRLDGTTKVDQRLVLMERFNNDKRIFAFILSTRSGGVGVNLTGADTVIFYDSDWNPTMDAQAQDRCHRIGQTRDVHIYRLVSEMTVEENILKKANQKRLLGDLAIEGGNFTTAYFKNSTIHELFNVNVSESSAARRMAEVLENTQQPEALLKVYSADEERQQEELVTEEEEEDAVVSKDRVAVCNLENVLAAAEDETDVIAARTARAEVAADLEEFDENLVVEENREAETLSKAEQDIQYMVEKLSPIERYAMKLVEESEAPVAAEQLAATVAEIEQQKKEWEVQRLRADEEERQQQADDTPSDLLTYSSRDARSQIWKSGEEVMPMWCPPTPPQETNDVYIDHNLDLLYENSPMAEERLPGVHSKRDLKRVRDYLPGGAASDRDRRPFNKLRRTDEVATTGSHTPSSFRSLFDRPSPALLKIRKELKSQKIRGIGGAPRIASLVPFASGLVATPRASPTGGATTQPDNQPAWLIFEDWALLQAVQSMQEISLNLFIINPGHTPNWDLEADMVNSVSRNYRSPKQCRARYESAIIPREEGRVQHEPSPKKLKKHKSLHKSQQSGRALRTSQLFTQDNGASYLKMITERSDVILGIAAKRTPPVKPMFSNTLSRNQKGSTHLADINYDTPLNPIEVVARRNERLNKIKNQQTNLAEQYRLQNQQGGHAATTTTHLVPAKVSKVAAVATTSSSSASSSPAAVAKSPPATPPPSAATAVASGQVAGMTPVVVNISQHPVAASTTVATVASSSQTSGGTTTIQTIGQQVRSPRTTVALTVQAPGGNLLPVTQIPMHQSQRFTTASLVATPNTTKVGRVTGTLIPGKNLTPQQVTNYIRQQQQFIQQQQQKKLQAAAEAGVITSATSRTIAGTATSGGSATVVGQKAATIGIATQGASGTATLAALQLQQRTPIQYQKPTSLVAQKRFSEAELNALLKRQQVTNQKAATAQAATTSAAAGSSSPAQVQIQTATSSPQVTQQTVQFKTTAATTSRAGTGTPQQVRQMTMQLAQRKLASGKVILQGNKQHISALTMQQLQMIKQGQMAAAAAGGNAPIVTHAVVTKNVSGGSVQRVIPVGTAAGNTQLKPTFQVVAATAGQQIASRSGNQVLTFQDATSRQPVSVTLSNRAGVSPAQTQAIISQVTAALNSNPTIIRQSLIPTQGAVRITSPSLVQQQKQTIVPAVATAATQESPASTSQVPPTPQQPQNPPPSE
ncbi:helicase domino isoform X2 [Neocloeon triangulifer]|uniref:helicase domino isoform X2 n=1 Tax=Neocloeon triangulifer TaxID=2078957 RepID=UPI00286F1284|nr:helicase domino isoform X2 [Neocloeon triangulifer]